MTNERQVSRVIARVIEGSGTLRQESSDAIVQLGAQELMQEEAATKRSGNRTKEETGENARGGGGERREGKMESRSRRRRLILT